ncbi:uncharacterized protein [Palaemon carinicauda]|uniref:uncharacterized protein n=1 Tax=Palaemon carinicauda TaxID=392227 RepID=UPI0035B6158F
MQRTSPPGYLWSSLVPWPDLTRMGGTTYWLCRTVLILASVSAAISGQYTNDTGKESKESLFVIDALLLYPSPFSGHESCSKGAASNHQKVRVESKAIAEKNYNEQVNVDIYTNDWDDMETCPYWCQHEDGSLYCCLHGEEEEHPGICPDKEEVCVRISYVVVSSNSIRCANDAGCALAEKCCFDRCLSARVCKTAIANV